MLINNSDSLTYERNIATLRKNFEVRGHHFVNHVDVPYNHAKRDLILNRLANRDGLPKNKKHENNVIVAKFQFS